jgi:hypothetical protein
VSLDARVNSRHSDKKFLHDFVNGLAASANEDIDRRDSLFANQSVGSALARFEQKHGPENVDNPANAKLQVRSLECNEKTNMLVDRMISMPVKIQAA